MTYIYDKDTGDNVGYFYGEGEQVNDRGTELEPPIQLETPSSVDEMTLLDHTDAETFRERYYALRDLLKDYEQLKALPKAREALVAEALKRIKLWDAEDSR